MSNSFRHFKRSNRNKVKKGFTLIELMIVLAIVTIIATASVPQIQMWTAKNRGKSAVSSIISDFAKAKGIGAYSTEESTNSALIYQKYVVERPLTGVMYRKSSYTIIQRAATITGDWKDDGSSGHTTVRKVGMPMNVTIENLNTGGTNDGTGASPTLVFTSNGRIKQTNNILVPLGAGAGSLKCGAEDSTLDGRRIFFAIIKSLVGDDKAMWYRVEIDSAGEFFVCMQPGAASSQSDFLGSNANILEM